ncbi:MAG: hypothetical protein KDA94_11380, partial [Acidimicrobiales bacterium]|nr:hypothetical protein [Acidimicrobiales bacterium]
LADARREATGLAGLLHRIGVLEADRDHARAQRSELEDRRSLLFVVSNQWPTWAEAAEARGALDQLGVVEPLPADAGPTLDQLVSHRDELAAQAATDAEELAAATEELQGLEAPGPVLDHTEAIAELAATLAVAADRADALPRLAGDVHRTATDLTATLASLGPDVDEAWLAEVPVDPDAASTLRATAAAVAEARRHLAHVRASAERAQADHDEASTTHAAREASLAERTAHPVDRARKAVEDAAALVALLDRRDTIAHRIATAQQPKPAPPPAQVPSYLVPSLAAAAVACLAGGAAAAATDAPVVGAGALVVGVVLVVLALLARRSPAVSSDAAEALEAAPSELAHELAEIDRSIAPLLATFRLDARPSIAEASNLRVRADQLAADASRLEQERADATERRRALDAHGQRLAERAAAEQLDAIARLDDASTAWAAWLTGHHLPETLDPTSAAEVLDAIARGRLQQRAATDARHAHDAAVAAHEAFAARASHLVATTGLATSADPTEAPLAAVAELEAERQRAHHAQHAIDRAEVARRAAERQHQKAATRANEAAGAVETYLASIGAASLEDAHHRIERAELAATLTRTITQAERDLKHSIGPDPERLAAARTLLTRADPVRWTRELGEFDEQLRAIDAEIDDATTELAHRTRERDVLERSADVPRAELRVADLEAQLVEAVTRWATLTTAHRMVEDTLARYQRERQPDVVKRAAAHFAQVTDGRYQRLEVRDHEIVAIDQAEREVHAHQLSKGTTQQLYLCMRFALAESYARTTHLPLLLDDITVHADDGRLPRLAELVAAVAVDHQVLVFTSQDATVQQLRSATPDTRLVSLDPGTAAAPSIGLAVS